MLKLLVRRARASWPLLAAVVAVVTIGGTLLGVSARLLTVSAGTALTAGMSRTEPAEVETIAYLSDIQNENAARVIADTRELLKDAVSPLGTPVTQTRASSTMRTLEVRGNDSAVGYLTGMDDLSRAVRLTAGEWPAAGPVNGVLPVVVLESTARAMRLEPGSRVRLGSQSSARFGEDDGVERTDLLVTGVAAPRQNAGWDRDVLGAEGFDQAVAVGYAGTAPGAGPFLVGTPALIGTGLALDRIQVDVQPALDAADAGKLDAVATRLATADRRLGDRLGDRVHQQRVASTLLGTVTRVYTQQAVTRSTVLVVMLLGTLLTASALLLAGRLVTRSRAAQTALFSAMGAGRGQQLGLAAGEVAGLALIATALSVPASSFGHAALTRLPALRHAGLTTGPGVSGGQVLVILIGVLALSAVLLLPALRSDPAAQDAAEQRGGKELLVRSGADLALVALAAVGWWQLQVQPTAQSGTDVVRILAPGLILLAGAALMVRLTGLPLGLADRAARRSRRLVLPLAAFEASRRPQAIAAALLLVLAVASGTFGLALAATWQQSQVDQADLAVGTDLRVELAGPAQAGQAGVLREAVGGTISPVLEQDVAVGQWLGGTGNAPHLVALNSADAGDLLRGRLPEGTSWAQIGAAIAPGQPAPSVALNGPPEITGSTDSESVLQITPQLVLQDAAGLRSTCGLRPIVLDGEPHRATDCDTLPENSRVVAVVVDLAPGPAADAENLIGTGSVKLSFRFPRADGDPGRWQASSYGRQDGTRVLSVAGDGAREGADIVFHLDAVVQLSDLYYANGQFVMAGFVAPQEVPVVVSQDFADVLGSGPGDRYSILINTVSVPVKVAAVVPDVPSAPGRSAMLADADLLGRVLTAQGARPTVGNAWWVGHPKNVSGAGKLGLGEVTTRDAEHQELSQGPLRVGVPAALAMLLPAVLLLAVGGLTLHVVSDLRSRAGEVARLRSLGLTRRTVTGMLLAQHGGLLVLLTAAGTALGAITAAVVGPLLIRSDLGAAPVPDALFRWPWTHEILLLAVLLLTGQAVIRVVSGIQVRAGDRRARG
ncbi:ABC transporter permease [Kineosporia mesophila]|uniref:ABC transporter permease n=1 Tax=Kineosporia mesophila TaxID=566012 RepID=A0ABP6YZ07_9ACTN|nr:FtsX-like permease family protein [Kineosporia mesophila]MCD5351093.1 hypothetical protein [Kineosporia mesophila]